MPKKLKKKACSLIQVDDSMQLGRISRAVLARVVDKMVVLLNNNLCDRGHS